MADTVIYEFDAWAEGVEEWSTNPGEMVDGVETDYASTTTDGDIQKLTGNECVGTDLGVISKVEIRAYAYGDADDELILRPVFAGTDDGDNHIEAPGVTAGWKTWWDITDDTNNPQVQQLYETADGAGLVVFGVNWRGQTFTTGSGYTIDSIALLCYRVGSPGTVTLTIQAVDGAHEPDGPILASATYDGDTLTDSADGEWVTFTFSTPYSLSGSTEYAIVVHGGTGASDTFRWRYDSAGGYADGLGLSSTDSGDTWLASAAYDATFRAQKSWAWSDIQALDCDVEHNDVAKGNTTYVGMVQIQVTYTAEAPPEGVAVQMMHYARLRRR